MLIILVLSYQKMGRSNARISYWFLKDKIIIVLSQFCRIRSIVTIGVEQRMKRMYNYSRMIIVYLWPSKILTIRQQKIISIQMVLATRM